MEIMYMTITDEMAAETLAADNTPKALEERRAALAKQLDEVDARLMEISRAEEARVEEEKAAAKAQAIVDIKAAMLSHGITAADLAGADAKSSKVRRTGGSGAKVAPKYRAPATGDTWSGRGLQPKWLKAAIEAGAELDSFRVA